MVAVPQAMAYASVAGVNPMYGLYTAIIPPVVASIFGSSNHIVTGPTNTIALAASGVLVSVAAQGNYPEYVFALAILSGIFMLLLGVLRLGFLIRYVSNSVLTGFLTGAAVLIIFNQVPALLGLTQSGGHSLAGTLSMITREISEIQMTALFLGMAGIAVLLLARRFAPRFPAALVLMFLSGWLTSLLQLQEKGVLVISQMGSIGLSQLRFHIPEGAFSGGHLEVLISGAGAVALLSLLEAVSVGRAIGMQTGQRIDANREFIGQGLASVAGGFFRGIPTSGSLTRSAVNYGGGAVTRFASGFSGVLVLLILLLFKDWIGYIPVVILASIVMVSALHMIDVHHLMVTWRGRHVSKVVTGVTFMAVLLLPLQVSIYLGVVLSIVFYLVESSHLELSYLVLNGNGKFVEKPIGEALKAQPEVAVINVEGPLFFAAVQDLEDRIMEMIDQGVTVIVLRLRRMHLLASSGLSTLEFLIHRAREKGGQICLSGVSPEMTAMIADCGLEDDLESRNIFLATDVPFESTHRALEIISSRMS